MEDIKKVSIKSNEVLKSLNGATNLDTQGFNPDLPSEMSKLYVPTIESNPIVTKFCDVVASTEQLNSSSDSLIYQTPIDKDFYLTSLYMISTSTSATNVRISLIIIVNGIMQEIGRYFFYANITYPQATLSLNFSHPIKIDRNTPITIHSSGYINPVVITTAGITGFTLDTNPYILKKLDK